MPTYVYACTNPDCGHQFEAVQSFTDDALTVCPACGQRLRKVFGSVGVVFKGSGFYRNDSREKVATGSAKDSPAGEKSGASPEPAAKGTAASESGASKSSKSDSAPSAPSSNKSEGSSASGSSPSSAKSGANGSPSRNGSSKAKQAS
jgi:putative FmdB family regulatory protein